MPQERIDHAEIEDLRLRMERLSITPSIRAGIKDLPPELLIDIFQRLDPQDLENVRRSSRALLPAANPAIHDKLRSECRRAGTAIYEYLLPEGETSPEYSDVNRQPHQPPKTTLTINAAAWLMDTIPENQKHLVQTVLSIRDRTHKSRIHGGSGIP